MVASEGEGLIVDGEIKGTIAIVVISLVAACFFAWMEHEEKMAGLQPEVEEGQ